MSLPVAELIDDPSLSVTLAARTPKVFKLNVESHQRYHIGALFHTDKRYMGKDTGYWEPGYGSKKSMSVSLSWVRGNEIAKAFSLGAKPAISDLNLIDLPLALRSSKRKRLLCPQTESMTSWSQLTLQRICHRINPPLSYSRKSRHLVWLVATSPPKSPENLCEIFQEHRLVWCR